MVFGTLALVGSLFVLGQVPVLVAVYWYARRTWAARGGPPRAFRVAYAVATALMTVGPLTSLQAVGRFEPYATPFGQVEPLTVQGAGGDAWVVGFALFLASFVGLWARTNLG